MPKILLRRRLLSILAVLFHLQVCLSKCVTTVIASRKVLYIPEGGSLSLNCDVLHCEEKWMGGWGVRQPDFTYLTPSTRVHLSNETHDRNMTRLILNINKLNQSDSGEYQCNINWSGTTSQGHVTKVNVTSVHLIVPEPRGRKPSHRFFICSAAFLCVTLCLALALARHLFSDRQPAPPVPRPRSRNSSTVRCKPKADVVYAALSLNHSEQQSATQATTATPAVIYSTLNFSTG